MRTIFASAVQSALGMITPVRGVAPMQQASNDVALSEEELERAMKAQSQADAIPIKTIAVNAIDTVAQV